jgi:ubiquinone/menaquinone biosynthesis C-methylase UbiE
MFLRRVLAQQLARPSGLPGRFMGRTLDRVNGRVNQIALDRLALAPGDQLLDVGFGGGLLIRQAIASAPGLFVAGIDVSRPMIARGRRAFRDEIRQGRVDIAEADVSSIPYADDRFDKAAAINTLHFWPDAAAGLREVRRVLKPGGTLVIAVRPKEFLERVRFTTLGFTAFGDAELGRLLEASGFEHVVVERHRDRDMGTVQAIAQKPGDAAPGGR